MISNYELIDKAVNDYKCSQDDKVKKDSLEFVIRSFKPLLIKTVKHFFGRVDEDMLSDGIEKIIILTGEFDFDYGSNFSGYMKKNIWYFYLNKKSSYSKSIKTCSDEVAESFKTYDICDYEIYSLFYRLNEKEKTVIRKNVLEDIKLKDVSRKMNISYIYAKKIKKSALDKLKADLETKEARWI